MKTKSIKLHKGPKPPPWSAQAIIELLIRLANAARDKGGRRIVATDRLLDLWDENRVRLMLDHEVPFSIECAGEGCAGCVASGDGLESLDDAIAKGWKYFEPAPADWSMSHFIGRCPECAKAHDRDRRAITRWRRQRHGGGGR